MDKWFRRIGFLLGGFAVVLLLLLTAPGIAQEPPDFYSGSWPDRNGDYPIRRQYHGTWKVVDPDPNGLNCRGNIPPFARSRDIVTTFPTGTLINLVKRDRGVFEIGDSPRGEPWLRVRLLTPEDIVPTCWVRANRRYVMPVRCEEL